MILLKFWLEVRADDQRWRLGSGLMTAKNMEAVEKGLDVLHPLDDYEAARKRRVSADHSLVAAHLRTVPDTH